CALHELGPIFSVEGLGEFLNELYFWTTKLRYVFGGARSEGAARVDPKRIMEGTHCQQVRAEETWFIAHAQNDRTRTIREEVGGFLILEIEEATHAVSACDQNVFHLRLGHQ